MRDFTSSDRAPMAIILGALALSVAFAAVAFAAPQTVTNFILDK